MMIDSSNQILNSLLTASMMMATVGAVTFLLLKGISIHSWRLRSCLAAAVLFQGVMIVRTPIHLGWIDVPAVATPILDEHGRRTLGDFENDLAVLADQNSRLGSIVTSNQNAREPRFGSPIVGQIGWSTLLIGLWIAVITTISGVALYRYLSLLGKIRQLRSAPADWQRAWKSLIRRSRSISDVGCCVMLVSQTAGPVIVRGIRKYWLIVPAEYWSRLSEDQRQGVMLHELAHLERRDVWRQLAVRMVAMIHWINPVAWWAVRQLEQAAEHACDQRVALAGKRTAAGFAAALVELIQWNDEIQQLPPTKQIHRFGPGVGVQAMATPPLTARISRLLQPGLSRDALMKKISLTTFLVVLIFVSFFQIRLTPAQEDSQSSASGLAELKVIADEVDDQLGQIASRLDVTDQTTDRFNNLLSTPAGKIAIAGYLDGLADQSREAARSDAIPLFVEHHFLRTEDGKLSIRSELNSNKERWAGKSQRLGNSIDQIRETTGQIAEQLDTSTEAGVLFKRLMQDPHAPIAILMNELDGADIVGRYLSEAFQDVFVYRADGSLAVVQSRRNKMQQHLQTIERAERLRAKLERELPLLAAEYSAGDDQHTKLVVYLKNPITAAVAALMLADDTKGSDQAAVDQLHEHFENVSVDTATGLKITNQEAWAQLNEIFARVDRATALMPRVQEELSQTAQRLATDDPLTSKLAEQMKRDTLACMLSAELPNPDLNVGDELRSMLTDVMIESDGKLVINRDREEPVTEKAQELLRVCRRIRRHLVEVNQLLGELSDREFVQNLGSAGPYAMLDEVRRFAEAHRSDPITLLQEDLLQQAAGDQWTVRKDRRELVRELVMQADKVSAEAGNDDF